MDIIQVLSFCGLGILLVNTILYSLGLAGSSKAYKSFFYYLLFLFIVQAAVEIHAMQSLNNHYLSTYYLLFNFLLLSFFFYYLFRHIKKSVARLIKYATPAIITGLAIQYAFKPHLYFEFNSIGFLITSAFIIVYSVLYLFELISNKIPYTYVIAGMLIYYISSSLIFASATSIVSFDNEVNMVIWKINAVLFIIYQLLILREWIQTFYRKTQARGQ